MTAANKILIQNNEDVSDINKHTYLLESMIYHMARLIKEDKRRREGENTIEGMDKFDELYNSVQNNLELGQEVKNYKELCKLLNREPVTGNQKKAQMKTFGRYFEYQRVGQKFVITDIFSEPLPVDDARKKGNNAIYVKFIEVILLHYLSKQTDYTCVLRKNQIWMLLGMVNQKYNKVPVEQLTSIDCVNTFMVNHFYQRCNQRLERILFTSLNNLKRQKLLSYYEQIVIVPEEGQSFIAGDKEIRILDAVAHSVLESMGLISMIQVYCKFKAKEFYDEVNYRLRSMYGWKYSYKQYKLIYTPENVIKALPRTEIALQRLTLNQTIVDAINKNAVGLYDKNQKEWQKAYELTKQDYWTFGIDAENLYIPDNEVVDENGNKVFRYPPYYLEAQRLLTDELIRIGKNQTDDEKYEIEDIFIA